MLPSSLPARVQWFFEALARSREQALEHLPEVFSDDITFHDPFRDTRGMPAFRELFVRMFRQYREIDFTDFRVVDGGDQFSLTYSMHLRMAVGPVFVTPMASTCRARDGRVFALDDHYNLTSGLLSPFGLLHRAYRGAIRALFL